MHIFKFIYFTLIAIVDVHGADLLTTLKNDADLSVLHDAITRMTDFVKLINSTASVTLFAPTNAAFAALDELSPESIAITSKSARGMFSILSYHIVPNRSIASSDLTATPVYLQTLLTPENVIGNEVAALVPGGQRVGLQNVEGTVTVQSGLGRISTVTQAVRQVFKTASTHPLVALIPLHSSSKSRLQDIESSDGFIHKIDSLLTLPVSLTATIRATGLKTFIQKLESVAYENFFDYASASTIFVPTDDAFSVASSNTQSLEGAELKALLKSHISMNNLVYAATLSNQGSVTTWSGRKFVLANVSWSISVSFATITVMDLLVRNGVAQIIDRVLD